jgi:flagellar hook assembly protein FlgD
VSSFEIEDKLISFLTTPYTYKTINPTTNIMYEVPNSGNVRITIYDSIGREIKTFVNEIKNSGTYEAQFDGSNLTSGVYFYKLQVNGNSIVKQMLLLK